jgi:hypothetical protein
MRLGVILVAVAATLAPPLMAASWTPANAKMTPPAPKLPLHQLLNPLGIRWGASPQEAQYQLIRGGFKYVGPTELSGNPDHFLHEQRYEGDMLGQHSDHIAPLFFGGRFFSIAVSYSPTPERPAAMIWRQLVDNLTAQYGPPASVVKPQQMVSADAVLKILPDGEQKNQLLAMYASADKNRDIGRYMLQDLEIRVGSWVPEAVWAFSNAATVKAVMRAGIPDQYGLTALKPAVVFANYDLMK